MTQLVYRAGVNDVDYNVVRHDGNRKQVWVCPFYNVWRNLLKRCFDLKYQDRNTTYKGCKIHHGWLKLSAFRDWMITQDWKGNHLDKDLFGDGFTYSPETCVFISRQLNNFISTDRRNVGLPTGVTYDKRSGKYCAQCVDSTSTFNRHIGTFQTAEMAHSAYKIRKREIAEILILGIKNQRVIEKLRERYAD